MLCMVLMGANHDSLRGTADTCNLLDNVVAAAFGMWRPTIFLGIDRNSGHWRRDISDCCFMVKVTFLSFKIFTDCLYIVKV